jgi:hypothetical protein
MEETLGKLQDLLSLWEETGIPFSADSAPLEDKLDAVKRNYRSIGCLLDQPEDLQMAAVTADSRAYTYIRHPSESVKMFMKLLG